MVGPFTARHLGLLVVVVGAAALLLVALTQPFGSQAPANALPRPGADFYVIGSETTGLEIGQKAPDFVGADGSRLRDLDGRTVALEDLRGSPVWVFFWATWCPPCQQETPDIQRAWEDHRDDGLVVLAIDVQEPGEVVAEYGRTYGLTYRIGLDPTAAVMGTYRVFGLPTHYFIDRDGVIRDRYFGPLTREQMDQRIEVIADTVGPP